MNASHNSMSALNQVELVTLEGGGWRETIDKSCGWISFASTGLSRFSFMPNQFAAPAFFCAGWFLAGKI
jgi:hypothetical protein